MAELPTLAALKSNNFVTPLPAAAMLSRTDTKKDRPRAVLFCAYSVSAGEGASSPSGSIQSTIVATQRLMDLPSS